MQFHSQGIANPPYEMVGYQADIGDGYWGSLYDESRRNKLLATADPANVKRLLRPNEWNDYKQAPLLFKKRCWGVVFLGHHSF